MPTRCIFVARYKSVRLITVTVGRVQDARRDVAVRGRGDVTGRVR